MPLNDSVASGRLAGKVAVVTGGTSGIGRACALKFAECGASVAIVGIDAAGGEAVVAEIEALGATARYIQADVGVLDDIESSVREIHTAFDGVDILLNNAAFHPHDKDRGGADGVEDAIWQKVLDVNLSAAYRYTRLLAPRMKERRSGSLIYVASYAAFRGVPERQALSYAVSKGALVTLARQLALAYAPFGIRSNAICPYCIETDLNRHLLADEAFRARQESVIPLRRIGTPQEVASVALFLASDESAYVTGQALIVDGGIDVSVPI